LWILPKLGFDPALRCLVPQLQPQLIVKSTSPLHVDRLAFPLQKDIPTPIPVANPALADLLDPELEIGLLAAYQREVVLDFSKPGKPTDNAYMESFNGKFRAECLNQHWFLAPDDARLKMEEWRRDYNEVRPHSAIGNKPPISLTNASGASGPP
jgi:hypothetical protein